MRPEIVTWLADPVDGSELELQSAKLDSHGRVSEGTLVSPAGRSFPIIRGVPRFVSDVAYAESFSEEWKAFRATLLKEEHLKLFEKHLATRLSIHPADFRNKVFLDVGVGAGRLCELARRFGVRQAVGIDLSEAVEVAAEYFQLYPNVSILQADVFALPFKPGVFDLIVSIGVLHHTPDCKTAVQLLPNYLKDNGVLAVGLYGGKGKFKNRVSAFYRFFLSRLPRSFMFKFSRVAIPLYHLHHLPAMGTVFRNLFPAPIDNNQNLEERVLNFFDWYTPRYQSHHKKEEVREWFRECGLNDIQVGGDVGVRGTWCRQPASGV